MLTSAAFEHGQAIPRKYTGQGEDASPPLAWMEIPEAAATLALICDDPDAPSPETPGPEPWVHWVIYNIPATAGGLPEGVPRAQSPAQPAGVRQGRNSWSSNNVGYRGPMPPPGSGTHRYFFKLYALDTELDLDSSQTGKKELLAAMEGHILAEGQLVGTYEIAR